MCDDNYVHSDPNFLAMERGVPPGGAYASSLFLEDFNQAVDQYLQQTPDMHIAAVLPWNDERIEDASLTKFADDMARKLVGTGTLPRLRYTIAKQNQALDASINPRGYTQNLHKQERSKVFWTWVTWRRATYNVLE